VEELENQAVAGGNQGRAEGIRVLDHVLERGGGNVGGNERLGRLEGDVAEIHRRKGGPDRGGQLRDRFGHVEPAVGSDAGKRGDAEADGNGTVTGTVETHDKASAGGCLWIPRPGGGGQGGARARRRGARPPYRFSAFILSSATR